LTVFEVAKREKNGVRTIPLHLEHLQAVRFPVNTPAYLDQIQSGMENHLRKVAQLRVWLNGGILYLIGLCHLTENVKMFVLDRGYYGASL
jgi:glycogen synthase